MSNFIFAMVLFAALGHAAWNLAARKVRGSYFVLWSSLVIGTVSILPLAIPAMVDGVHTGLFGSRLLMCVLASGAVHMLYYHFLALAYRHGEISVVYPLARGSGVVLTALAAVPLLDEKIRAFGALGIALIFIGIVTMGLAEARGGARLRAVFLSLAVGATIVAYSLVDKVGATIANPMAYLVLTNIVTAFLAFPVVWLRCRDSFKTELRTSLKYATMIGVCSTYTYVIILFAFRAAPVGYVASLRESAIVFGAIAGMVFLKEKPVWYKFVAIALIVAGAVCIKLA